MGDSDSDFDFSFRRQTDNTHNLNHNYSESFRKIVAGAIYKIKKQQELRKAIFRKQISSYRPSKNQIKGRKTGRFLFRENIEKLIDLQSSGKQSEQSKIQKVVLPIIIQSRTRIHVKSLTKSEDFQDNPNMRSPKAFKNRPVNLNISVDCKNNIEKFQGKLKNFKVKTEASIQQNIPYQSKSTRRYANIFKSCEDSRKYKHSNQFFKASRYAELSSKLVPWDFQKPQDEQEELY